MPMQCHGVWNMAMPREEIGNLVMFIMPWLKFLKSTSKISMLNDPQCLWQVSAMCLQLFHACLSTCSRIFCQFFFCLLIKVIFLKKYLHFHGPFWAQVGPEYILKPPCCRYVEGQGLGSPSNFSFWIKIFDGWHFGSVPSSLCTPKVKNYFLLWVKPSKDRIEMLSPRKHKLKQVGKIDKMWRIKLAIIRNKINVSSSRI